MRCVFRLSDGRYCDREDSHPPGVTDPDMVESGNVLGRFGGTLTDYAVVETDDPSPHLCRFVGGKVVRDAALESAAAAAVQAAEAEKAQAEGMLDRIEAGTATHAELCAFVAKLAGRG